MSNDAWSDAMRDREAELEADMAALAQPVEPSPQLKSSIMDAIASGKFPQVAPGEQEDAGRDDARVSADNVVPLSRVPDSRSAVPAGAPSGVEASGGTGSDGPSPVARGLLAAAAAVVLLAGVGFRGTTNGWWGGGQSVTHSDQQESDAEDQPPSAGDEPLQGAAAEDYMHSIMAMDDVRRLSLSADGSTLDVVVSTSMDSGGAMVNGIPQLGDGMGAQVWSIDKGGNARSAGVIGQDPHDNVWMPLPADTMKVRVTEEPAAGSEQPSGSILAEGAL